MKKTVVIQVGNTDNKLTQQEWAGLCIAINEVIEAHGATVHFMGGPATFSPYQNCAWVIEIPAETMGMLKRAVSEMRGQFKQDSAMWGLVDQPEFV